MFARVEVDQRDLRRLVRALNAEADGGELKRDLAAELKVAVEPFAQQARASILSMQTSGLYQTSPGLRDSIAAQVAVEANTGGRNAGVSVIVRKRGMPRNFRNAPKLTNRRTWRHRVFGMDVWVGQTGKPGWFDDTMQRADAAAEQAAKRAMDQVAKRIENRTHN